MLKYYILEQQSSIQFLFDMMNNIYQMEIYKIIESNSNNNMFSNHHELTVLSISQ